MRIIEGVSGVRIGVRKGGIHDGKIWRIFVDGEEEEIPVANLYFLGDIPAGSLSSGKDLTRDNPGGFLGWIHARPKRIEVRDGDEAYIFFS